MTVISESKIATEESTGQILIQTGATTRITVSRAGDVNVNGTVIDASGVVTNSSGLTLRPTVGGITSYAPGAVTAFTIAHGLGAVPSQYIAAPASGGSITAGWFSITANSANIELRYASALTAVYLYGYTWIAHP